MTTAWGVVSEPVRLRRVPLSLLACATWWCDRGAPEDASQSALTTCFRRFVVSVVGGFHAVTSRSFFRAIHEQAWIWLACLCCFDDKSIFVSKIQDKSISVSKIIMNSTLRSNQKHHFGRLACLCYSDSASLLEPGWILLACLCYSDYKPKSKQAGTSSLLVLLRF